MGMETAAPPTPHEMTRPDAAEASRRIATRNRLLEAARTTHDPDAVHQDLCRQALGKASIDAVLAALSARRLALQDPATLLRERFDATHLDADRVALLRQHPDELREPAIQWQARCLASEADDLRRRSNDGYQFAPHPREFTGQATAQVAAWLEAQ